MLSRQRAILGLLTEAGGTATHLEVTKWAFLLRKETSSQGGSAFFQFLPYKYGPFSFCLYQETSALAREGYIQEVNDRTWAVSSIGRTAAKELDNCVKNDIRTVLNRFRGKSANELFGYVYDQYKWFTINSVNDARMKRPETALAIYTAGYEGLSVDGFLNGLLKSGMRLLVDVRNNPISRRYGFHKSTLARLCGNVGIKYVHFPELGIQSSLRQDLDSMEDRRRLFDRYQRTTLQNHDESICQIGKMLQEQSGVLVCMEADYTCCHRSRLAEAVTKISSLEIQHLGLDR